MHMLLLHRCWTHQYGVMTSGGHTFHKLWLQQIHRKYHFELLASEALNSSSLALGGGVPESRQELRCLSLTHELYRGNSVSANERKLEYTFLSGNEPELWIFRENQNVTMKTGCISPWLGVQQCWLTGEWRSWPAGLGLGFFRVSN